MFGGQVIRLSENDKIILNIPRQFEPEIKKTVVRKGKGLWGEKSLGEIELWKLFINLLLLHNSGNQQEISRGVHLLTQSIIFT